MVHVSCPRPGNVSSPLSTEALGCSDGYSITLDAWCRRRDDVRRGSMPLFITIKRKDVIINDNFLVITSFLLNQTSEVDRGTGTVSTTVDMATCPCCPGSVSITGPSVHVS